MIWLLTSNIITPATIFPSSMVIKDRLKSRSKKAATKEPVHTPVPGRGTATNMNNPIRLYFFTVSLLRIDLLYSQSAGLPNSFVFLKYLRIGLAYVKTNGTGIIPPIMPNIKADKGSRPRDRAKGMANFNSRRGTADTPMTNKSSANIESKERKKSIGHLLKLKIIKQCLDYIIY
jgi:hypothetical protein